MLVAEEQSTTPSKKITGQYKIIAERMKDYESKFTTHTIDPYKPFILRLDGHGFKRVSSSFRKPFDPLLHELMIRTCTDLIEMYPLARTAFTASDEISLIFPSQPKAVEQQTFLGGRVLKICTLVASYCSVRFNHHCLEMRKEITPEVTKKYEQTIKQLGKGDAHFDARIFNLPNDEEILYNIMWRSTYDCVRNSKMGLGRAYFPHTRIEGMKSWQVVDLLRREKGVEWNDQPAAFRYGSFIKRELVEKQTLNPITKEQVTVARTKITPKAFGIPYFSKDFVHMLLQKYWNDVPPSVWDFIKT